MSETKHFFTGKMPQTIREAERRYSEFANYISQNLHKKLDNLLERKPEAKRFAVIVDDKTYEFNYSDFDEVIELMMLFGHTDYKVKKIC